MFMQLDLQLETRILERYHVRWTLLGLRLGFSGRVSLRC